MPDPVQPLDYETDYSTSQKQVTNRVAFAARRESRCALRELRRVLHKYQTSITRIHTK